MTQCHKTLLDAYGIFFMPLEGEGTYYVDYVLTAPSGKLTCVAGPFEGIEKAKDFVVLLRARYTHGEVSKVSSPRRIPE